MSHRAMLQADAAEAYEYSRASAESPGHEASPAHEASTGSAASAWRNAAVEEEKDIIQGIQEKLEEKQRRLQELDEFYEARRQDVRRRILQKQDEVDNIQRKLAMYKALPQKFRISEGPPGCQFLRFVDQTWFDGVVALVIVLNLLLIVMEIFDDTREKEFFWWDSAILTFYIVEFGARLARHHQALLIGPCKQVWTFWVDLLIILVGILDLWLSELVFGGSPEWAQYLGGLRVVRVVKLVRLLEDTTWADEKGFQLFIMSVILLNAMMIGLQINLPSWQGFQLLDNLMLSIFAFEIVVRIRNSGCRFFSDPKDMWYNCLDFVIVILGVAEQWVMPFIGYSLYMSGAVEESPFAANKPQAMVMKLLRLFRLLRLLRLIRLIREIPPLYTLALGILESFQGMSWVFLLALLVLYTCAILCTQLIGHRLLVPADFPENASAVFPTVGDSMFVLFKIMNADTEDLDPLFHALPLSKLLAACFMILSNWAILAILTAVVSENLISACADHRKTLDDAKQLDDRQKLKQIFSAMDSEGDSNRKVSLSEFNRRINDKGIDDSLKDALDAVNIPRDDLPNLFELLSKQPASWEEPQIDLDDFLDALHFQSKEVSQRTLMRMERRIGSLEAMVLTLLGESPPSPAKSPLRKRKGSKVAAPRSGSSL